MQDATEQARLSRLYEDLRLRLLDLSKRNQLLNYKLSARSKRFLQIVDCSFEEVHKRLADDEESLRILALPEPDEIPADERTEEFRSALDRGFETDVEYLTALDAMESTGREDDAALAKLERQLRDRVREELGLPPRRSVKEVNRAEHARSLGIEPTHELPPAHKARDGRVLQTLKYPDELEAILDKIAGDARLAEQEMGLSTLFLAFGFLEWYESDASDKLAYAPLLLLPVSIEKQKVRGKTVYALSVREGGAEVNLSLQKLLEQRFSRALPEFELTEGETLGSIEAYIDKTNIALDGLKRWRLHRWLVLGHFAFGRFAMYADLKPENWGAPTEHDLVGSILRGVEKTADPNALPAIPDDYPIDEPEIEKIAPFLIQDADASQHSALVDVMKGKNLVIQGPPGTGKSQTITNIIANALAAGKRVLFLAEKQAALEVVKRRLDRAGLGDFCLELHSDKASSKSVVASLKARYELGVGRKLPEAVQTVDSTWARSRTEIGGYVRALHFPASDGATAFGLIWEALRGRSDHADVVQSFNKVKFPDALLKDPCQTTAIGGELEVLADAVVRFTENFGHPNRSPWAPVKFSDVPTYDAPRFMAVLADLMSSVESMQQAVVRHSGLGISAEENFASIAELNKSLGAVPTAAMIPDVASVDLSDLESALAVQSEILAVESELASMPRLRNEDPDKLALATEHARAASSHAFLDQSPAQAYKLAHSIISELLEKTDVIEGVLPVLQILGLGEDAPVSQLGAVATGTIIAGLTPAPHRRWIRDLPQAQTDAVIEALQRWQPLVEVDGAWKSRLAGYSGRNSKLSPEEIEGVAKTLQMHGLAKILSRAQGSYRAAYDFGKQLGFGEDLSSAELDTFASHLRAVRAFETDPALAALFHPVWQGLETPIDEILGGIRMREFISGRVTPLSGGEAIVNRLLSIDSTDFETLAAFVPACKLMAGLAVKLHHVDTSVNQFLSELRRRTTDLHAFLNIDSGRRLSDIDAPISGIAHAHNLIGRIERLKSSLVNHATGAEATKLGTSSKRIEQARTVIAWVRVVQASTIDDSVKQRLLSLQVVETRGLIDKATREWVKIEADWALAVAGLAEFGAESLSQLSRADLSPLLDKLLAHGHELPDFISLRLLRAPLEAAGLADFLACADLHALDPKRLTAIFRALVAERRAATARRVPELATATGTALEARRRAFADRDLTKIRKDRSTIQAKLLIGVPPAGSNSGSRLTWTDMRLLGNEFPKESRFTPVRQLMARGGGAIQALKPCFMMSPLSLAKFIKPRSLTFDLLVIDEASQMRPEDALGGLLRARQIAVVGDTKQLPPTDFFNRGEPEAREGGREGDEEDDDIDAESILEACEATFGQRRRLKWHYRSRCESLIAFSNRTFYENSLITFPMARPASFSIELVRVEGTYRSRNNPAEAARIAEESIAFMRQFADVPEDNLPTLGVIAVNVEQRDLILDELRRLWGDDELVERYRAKAKAKGEPFDVKNLENVQGDERDHIFISLTYGPKHGETSVAQNFGPINRKQGHRRLNVLFTRARVRIGLFASFGSIDVRPTDASSLGVHTLKQYLEYAETQGRAAVRRISGEPDSDFESEVAHRLRLRSYNVDLQVGVSGFRIDLGVRHPDHPERFLAGLECDGAAYHSSKSARDRDRLREEVLKGLGWEIVRVWSTDWFDNPDLETERLVKKLEELRLRPPPVFESYMPLSTVTVDMELEEKQFEDGYGEDDSVVSCGEIAKPESGLPGDPSNGKSESAMLASAGLDLLDADGPLTREQAVLALEALREHVLRPAIPDWEAHRSILRPAMIETFIQQRIYDPADWYIRIPQYLRSGTSAAEKNEYLQRICEIVERMADGHR
jgi:very-short-patch-repair endonuclease